MSLLEGQVKGCCPVRWLDHGRQAIMVLPEHVDLAVAGPIREQLLTISNRGAETLIADMSATMSCDLAGADTLARGYQRAAASGTELRLVVTAPVIRRLLAVSGLDRLVSVYPALEAALAAHRPPAALPTVPRPARAEASGEALPDAAEPVAVIREATEATQREKPTAVLDPVPPALAPQQHPEEMLDGIASRIFEVGIVLSTAVGMPPGSLEKKVDEAVQLLEDIVSGIYDAALGCGHAPDTARTLDGGVHRHESAGEREGAGAYGPTMAAW